MSPQRRIERGRMKRRAFVDFGCPCLDPNQSEDVPWKKPSTRQYKKPYVDMESSNDGGRRHRPTAKLADCPLDRIVRLFVFVYAAKSIPSFGLSISLLSSVSAAYVDCLEDVFAPDA